jgi:hypothetical protein
MSLHLSQLEIGGAKRISQHLSEWRSHCARMTLTSGVLRGDLATTLLADVVFLRVVTRRRATLSSAELTYMIHSERTRRPK